MVKKKQPRRAKHPEIYAFIDSQNLNLGTSKNIYKNRKLIYRGWQLDFKKFRQYLADKFRVSKAFLFIGYLPSNRKLGQIIIPNRKSESSLLKKFQAHKVFISRDKQKLIAKEKGRRSALPRK
jgi:hypothetical protein